MKLPIMQPYFFPYIGYLSLIKHTDKFIAFDPVQFIRHGWIERNRILKPNEGWQYIQVPLLKHGRDTLIQDVKIRNEEDWKTKILRQLEHYRKTAPYYKTVINFIEDCWNYETDNITEQNVYLLEKICSYLEIPFYCQIFSKMNLQLNEISEPDEWALEISKALNASEYINASGGQEFFNPIKYKNAGIQLKFITSKLQPYNQKRNTFEAGLSIIDVMMFNDVKNINIMLDNVELSE